MAKHSLTNATHLHVTLRWNESNREKCPGILLTPKLPTKLADIKVRISVLEIN